MTLHFKREPQAAAARGGEVAGIILCLFTCSGRHANTHSRSHTHTHTHTSFDIQEFSSVTSYLRILKHLVKKGDFISLMLLSDILLLIHATGCIASIQGARLICRMNTVSPPPPIIHKLIHNILDTSAAIVCVWNQSLHRGSGYGSTAACSYIYDIYAQPITASAVNQDVSPCFYSIK